MCKNLFFSILILLGFGIFDSLAQQAAITSGGDVSSDRGSVSYSVGQIIVTANNGVDGSVSQGVQQPYEVSVISSLGEDEYEIDMSAYPNPVSNYLLLEIPDVAKDKSFEYLLYDVNGKLIYEHSISNNSTKIDMQQLIPGTYYLNINNKQITIRTYKIIKQ